MSWFYPFKVNAALAGMAVSPSQFEGEWRSHMQQMGKAAGLTPQETAVGIVAYGLGIKFPDAAENAIGVWRREKKIDLTKPEVIDALSKMGFEVDQL